MKIAIIVPFYPPSIGGVEAIAKDTAEELVKRGYEVSVITSTYDNRWVNIAQPGKYYMNGVNVYRLKPSWFKLGYAALLGGLKNVIREIKPDIVHCHNLHPHLFQAARWKDELNYKVIAQLHCPKATGINHLSAKLMFKPITHYLKWIQSRIDAFIAHSDFETIWLKEIGIKESKIYKVRYPCIPRKLLERSLRTESRVENYMLYIGRISWRKGLHVLLKSYYLVKDLNIKLIIAGPRDKESLEKLLGLSKELKLDKRVIFMNEVSEEEKYRLMSKSAFFIYPSIKDYTPITLLEAQALGNPVISTKVGAIPEIVKNGETGILVNPNNIEDLANAIKELALNRKVREKMGAMARKWIEENFLLESTIDELEKIYTSALE